MSHSRGDVGEEKTVQLLSWSALSWMNVWVALFLPLFLTHPPVHPVSLCVTRLAFPCLCGVLPKTAL